MRDSTRKGLRGVALGLQLAAIAAYFFPPLVGAFSGGRVGLPWLILGVINTVVFCVIFSRTSGAVGRLVLGVILTICTALWCVGLLLFVGVLSMLAGVYEWSGLGVNLLLYVLFAFAAAVFAVSAPIAKNNTRLQTKNQATC